MWTFCVACCAVSCGHSVLPVVQSHVDIACCLLCTVSCGCCVLPVVHSLMWTLCFACCAQSHMDVVFCLLCTVSYGRCVLTVVHSLVWTLCVACCAQSHMDIVCWLLCTVSRGCCALHAGWCGCCVCVCRLTPTLRWCWARRSWTAETSTCRTLWTLSLAGECLLSVWAFTLSWMSTFGPIPSFPVTRQRLHLVPSLLSPWHGNVYIWSHPFFPHDMATSTFGPTLFFPHDAAVSMFVPTSSFPMRWQRPHLVPPLLSPWHGNVHIWSHLFFPHDMATSTFGPTSSFPMTQHHPYLTISLLSLWHGSIHIYPTLFLQWCGTVHTYPHPFFSHDMIITSTFSPITHSFPACVGGWVGMKVNGKNIRCELFSPVLYWFMPYVMPVYSVGLRTWICWGWTDWEHGFVGAGLTEDMDLLGLDWLRPWICWGWTENMDLLGLDWLRTWICWGWTDWEHGFVEAGLRTVSVGSEQSVGSELFTVSAAGHSSWRPPFPWTKTWLCGSRTTTLSHQMIWLARPSSTWRTASWQRWERPAAFRRPTSRECVIGGGMYSSVGKALG